MQPFHLEWLHSSKLKFLCRPRALEMACGDMNELAILKPD
jgi:hypothetical protein